MRLGINGFQAKPILSWENPQSDVIGVRLGSLNTFFFL